jgi:xylulokinase
MPQVTVGIDIGTTSVKAVAVDEEGNVLSRSRVPHPIVIPSPGRMEHDARRAWRSGPMKALSKLGAIDPRGVAVSAMVPSITAVDRRGRPLTPGLLYGDERGRTESEPHVFTGPEGVGEIVGFLRWTAEQAPKAAGYWPAQAVANKALGGPPAVDLGVAFTSAPLFGDDGWDKDVCNECGVSTDQLAILELPGAQVGNLAADGPPLAAGTVDVWCEQLVAGASQPGDVHVVCGTTLIVWAMLDRPVSAPGLWSVGGAKGLHMVGGASNAGGLFLDWANRLIGRVAAEGRVDPANVPVWAPYPRGERTPYHDPSMRASLHGLDLTHGPAALRRAAWEASAFVVRHHLELGGVEARRLVVTGGGTKVEGWMHALADATRLPVHVAADPEGAARGAAFLARVAAGLESDVNDAERWARTGHIVEPDERWVGETEDRYRLFLANSGTPPAGAAG